MRLHLAYHGEILGYPMIAHSQAMHVCTVEPPNKGHFGGSINSADLSFVERFSSLGGSKCIVKIILGL